MDEEEDKIVTSDPILANKVNRFDREFAKFDEEEDMSGGFVETEDPFALDGEDDSEFSGSFQAEKDPEDPETESKAGEIN